MSGDTLAIDTGRCGTVAQAWYIYAADLQRSVVDLLQRGAAVGMAPALAPAGAIAAEIAEELRAAGDLLAATARASAAVGFDAVAGWGAVAGASAVLQRSLTDVRGARPLDLPDPTPAGDEPRPTAHFGDLPLFGPGGPTIDDVNQGALGDCWFEAVIAAVAATDPDTLRSMIRALGDGTYEVTLDGRRYLIDDEFPVTESNVPVYQPGANWTEPEVAWPMVLQKAMALHAGGSYGDIAGDDASRALDLFGDADETVIDGLLWFGADSGEVTDTIVAALDERRPVTATADGMFGMGGSHVWTVTDVDLDAPDGATVTIRNPWGRAGFSVVDGVLYRNADADDVTTHGRAFADVDVDDLVIDGASVTMPLDEFVESFDEVDELERWQGS